MKIIPTSNIAGPYNRKVLGAIRDLIKGAFQPLFALPKQADTFKWSEIGTPIEDLYSPFKRQISGKGMKELFDSATKFHFPGTGSL